MGATGAMGARVNSLAAAALIALQLMGTARGNGLECSPGVRTAGATFPRGDIIVEYGRPLRIDCVLDPALNRSSADLSFARGGDPVDPAYQTIVNESVLRLEIERPPMSNSVYSCRLLTDGVQEAVCMNMVIVGEKPAPVVDFECVSENRERLVCSWTPPFNYLKVNYSLNFTLSGRSSRQLPFHCPQIENKNSSLECVWSMSTTPQYKQVHPTYLFNLLGENALDRLHQQFTFNHFANIKPAPVENVIVSSTTPSGAELSFKIPMLMIRLPKSLEYRMMYTSEHSEGVWKAAAFEPPYPGKENREFRTALSGLEYANALYDLRIAIRVEGARLERLWSENASVTFRTAPERPRRPPDLVVGCFESQSKDSERRDVYVYWSRLEKREEGGENFTYRVIRASSNGVEIALTPDLTSKNFMRFAGFPASAVELSIVSTNKVGDSSNASTVFVPATDAILPEPKDFTKKAFGNGLYELLWSPADRSKVKNYTIFWCDDVKDRPYQCQGKLAWMTVEADKDSVNVNTEDADKIYQFAISANGHHTSSGMVWAGCTIISDRPAEKMRSVWIDKAGDVFIELGWRLECLDRGGQVIGYNVSYCPIYDPEKKLNCGSPSKSKFIPGGTKLIRGVVDDLKPYTTYRLSVAVVTKGGAGNPSDYLYNTTSEGAPTPLRLVSVTELRNNSALVSWETPKTINGVLKSYRVTYSWIGGKITKDAEKANSLLLTDLNGYTNYTINVLACTTVCSSASNPVVFRTAIGRPGPIKQLMIFSPPSPSRALKISWDPPIEPGGTLDLYEVKIVKKMNDGSNHTYFNTTTLLTYEVPFKACDTPDTYAYYFYIRAVNYDKAIDHGAAAFTDKVFVPTDLTTNRENPISYKGDWSRETFNICSSNQSTSLGWILGVVGLFILGIIIYCLKIGYQRFKVMKNIKPCMPPGLDLPCEKDPMQNPGKWSNPNKHIKDSDKSSLTPYGDAESLLTKPTASDIMDRSGICERSNCSANTDSTAVSLTSNRVCSDEAKETSEDQDCIQPDTLSDHSSIRNIGCGGSRRGSATSTESLNLRQSITEDADTAPAYCAIGTDWPQGNINPRTAAPCPGYVALGKFIKPKDDSNEFPFLNGMDEKCESSLITPIAPVNELPSDYVMNGIVKDPIKHLPIVQPKKATSGYVSVDDPRVNGMMPPSLPKSNQSQAFSDNIELFPVPSKFNSKNSDYVKRNDSIITNGIDPSCLQKIPPQTNSLSVNLPSDNISSSQAALSPEAYCRFGPNTNVPHHFEFKQSDNIDSDYAASLKDDPEIYFEEPPLNELPMSSSHYVRLEH